jgi:uncharacterized protein (TIGR00730 family)
VRTLQRVCVFCGSKDGQDPALHDLAGDLGTLLAKEQITLVYGGAQVGLMGRLADAVLDAGGSVTGVLPGGLFSREVPHSRLTELRVVDGMHERKSVMYDLADGFIALPGGYGTLDELFEAATWNTLGLHAPRKPITLLDPVDGAGVGFWDPLSALLDQFLTVGFVMPTGRAMLQRSHSPVDALEQLRTYEF